ncbi:chemotaxis protein CheD [Natranaerobius thermophilus]|uniref:Probable chemoreceptor glutamine deamidase CheD n=1 Tax=Natranaerobius thermophilus (strain ATCC BAA-1301 / DSM 18059 / JW/NM-WN-LF) TaxID=457570 RepID=B2A374_NATTJ|nr:chemotaxis protein CheD [Natranaerobius thermophilus]ACB85004.1 CheD [Natranaerobius thermophilus JW/NM-WN-LF]
MTIVKVGIADMKVASKESIIRTSGLGSCVGITLYDGSLKIGGMVHIMLPESPTNKSQFKRTKYADTGIVDLLTEMENMGCKRRNLVSKMAGGAHMFKFSGGSELLKIGERNAKAVEEVLTDLKVKILAKDVGGDYGRTIDLFCETGKLQIKTINRGVKEV